jgi:NAD-dependent deacetylase
LRALALSGQNHQVAADRQGEAAPADRPAWTREVTRLAVLTGAGISTDSGIPDFRGPSGVWTKNPAAEKLSTYQAYMADPELRRRSWQSRLAHPAWGAQPNPAHLAVARLARSTIDTRVITQNIDGLHQRAGTPPGRVIELHGTMSGAMCTGCGDRSPMADVLARVRAGESDPPCARCGAILKSATVMFGENLDPEVFERAAVAIGSTLLVEPAASLCPVAAEAGAALVIVNRDPTPYDLAATAVIREPIGTAVPRIASQLLEAPAA